MSRALRTLPILATLAGLAGAVVPTQAAEARTALTHNIIPGIERAPALGAAPPATVLHLNISLRRPDVAGEEAYVRAISDPHSPLYRQAMSVAAFDARFGVSAATYAAAATWLRQGGMTVTDVPGSRDDLLATGSVSAVEHLLHVRERTYAGGVVANADVPSVPVAIPVLGITGLTNREERHLPGRGAATPRPAAAAGLFTSSYTAQDLWHIYHLPDNNKGEGQSIAIFLWGKTDNVLADLRTFEVTNHLPQVPLVKHYYGTDAVDTNAVDQSEANLDLQASTGMAPNVQKVTMYLGNQPSDTDLLAATNAWVADPAGALSGSASYGGCEEAGTASALIPVNPNVGPGDTVFEPAMDQALRKAVAMGRSFFTSTGDTGSSCPFTSLPLNGLGNEVVPLASYPAASPYAIGVGGTVLYGDGSNPENRVTEYSWPYTGGGSSSFVAAPAYQQGVGNIIGHCLSQPDGSQYSPPAPICRGTPDVAAISGDVSGNGYAIYDGGATNGAGTSLSSPLWAGFWARIEAAAPARNGGFPGNGFANPLIYAIGKDAARYANDFHDITTGANGAYAALPGWDYTSGWGVPDVTNLMRDIAGGTAPANPLPAPVPALLGKVNVTPCSPTVFTDAAGDDVFAVQGQTIGAAGSNPQLDILKGAFFLSADGQTLKLVITLKNLSTTIPAPGLENNYRFLFDAGGSTYFVSAAVEPGGQMLYLDGTKITVGPETRFQFLHTDTGSFTPGPNGTVEIDVPLANIGSPAVGALLTSITGETDVRLGAAQAGLLETVDTAGPQIDYGIGLSCRPPASVAGTGSLQPLPKPGATLPNTARTAAVGGAWALAAAAVWLAGVAARRRRRVCS